MASHIEPLKGKGPRPRTASAGTLPRMDLAESFFLPDDQDWHQDLLDTTEEPPVKRTKTSHPHSVICCDQPCLEDNLCWDDFCHDFCTDLCKQPPPPCTECPDADLGAECDDPDCFQPECTDECSVACADPSCGMNCPESFCQADRLETCADPSTACYHDCDSWCQYHGLDNCLDCMSSPTTSDARTPQPPASAYEGFLDPLNPAQYAQAYNPRAYTPFFNGGQSSLYQANQPVFDDSDIYNPSQLLGNASGTTGIHDTRHKCLVKGCTAASFKNEDELQDHIEKSHLIKVNGRYVCQWEGCVKKVTKKSNEHMQREKEARALGLTYQPPPEPFSDDHLHKLKRHYYVHSGKKAFECDYPGCGSVHATKAQLKVHKARHKPKEFSCEDCEKVFTTQNQLKTHINAVHKKQKHFKCPECDYACDDSSNMSSHKRKQHQLGVVCPSNTETGCLYRDGRQSDMEKHMRSCDHAVWMLEDKDVFDTYWKGQKRSTTSH